MARQIIENTLKVYLPEYTDEVSGYSSNYEELSVVYTVAPQQLITITDVSVEQYFENIPVDITGKIKTYDFILYFTHPQREVPSELYAPKNTKSGIVAVSLDEMHSLFARSKTSCQSYKEILLSFLKDDLTSKHWVFHPRHEAKKATAENQLSTTIQAQNERLAYVARSHKNIFTDQNRRALNLIGHVDGRNSSVQECRHYQKTEHKPAKYECAMCRTQWEGLEPGINKCPKCNTHLYAKLLGYIT